MRLPPQRAYLRALLVMAACVYLPFVGWAWRDQAPSGDLARIGAWSEREYGWRAEQPRLQVRHNRADRIGATVWVLGDSFSMGNVWQSVWADRAGVRVHTLGWNGHACLEAFIDQALAPAQSAVSHIVVQTIERHLVDRLGPSPACPPSGPVEVEGPPGTTRAHRASWTLRPGRAEGVGFMGVWPQVDWRHLIRTARNEQRVAPRGSAEAALVPAGDTLNAPLASDGPFSNRRPDRLLFYLGDDFKRGWSKPQLEAAAQHAARLQAKVRAAGKQLTVLVVPDKSTVYRPWLPEALAMPQWPIEAVFRAAGVSVEYPVQAMREAARERVDFYLPDDTHLSPIGFEWLGDHMARKSSGQTAAQGG